MKTLPDLTDTHNAECRQAMGEDIGAVTYLRSQQGGDNCATCRMGSTIQRVREMHSEWVVVTHYLDPDAVKYCRTCSLWHDCEEWSQTSGKSALVKVEWPCPTLRALDGEQA